VAAAVAIQARAATVAAMVEDAEGLVLAAASAQALEGGTGLECAPY
tara:strand:- start:299 stop:436 length:138 start_codon:yes stop_codon:yes gene_type:complete